MAPRVNLVVEQGATFYQEATLTDQNGDPLQIHFANGDPIYTASGKLRKSHSSSNSVSFVTAISNGSLVLSLTSNVTANIEGGRYVYDVEFTSIANSHVDRIMEGFVTVRPEVTK